MVNFSPGGSEGKEVQRGLFDQRGLHDQYLGERFPRGNKGFPIIASKRFFA